MSGLEQDFRILERVSTAVADDPAPRSSNSTEEPVKTRTRWNLPGIYSGTRLSTSFGEVPAHLIRVRDQLRTKDGKFLRVLRIDEYKLDADFLSDHPEARPVRFASKAHGKAKGADIFLSPGQRVLARGASGQEVLKLASEFTAQPGALPDTAGPFSYFIFHLGKAALVRAEGMWVAVGV